MSELKDIHRKALDIAKKANDALEQGDKETFIKFSEEAYFLETKAADMLFGAREAEPTRSVLYRSAATLAYNCGKLDESKKLIYAGLSGTPYPEIRLELEQLLSTVKHQIEARTAPQEIADRTYLSILQNEAVNLKLVSKTHKYSRAIYTDHIIDFLKTINNSYTNFSKVNFRKAFTSLTADTESMLENFLKESRPLCVNLGFKSFGVSIIADNKTMFNSDVYSEAFSTWKDSIFKEYKEEVILPDYNSPSFLENVKTKYTDEERNLIYSPILDKIKDATPYVFSLTENDFETIIKTYKQPEKSSKDILNPPQKKTISEPDTKILTRSIDLVSSTGKGKKKNLDFEMLDNAEWKARFRDIETKTKTINLNDEYLVKILYSSGTFTIEDTYLNVYSSSSDYDSVLNQYKEKFVEVYSALLEKQDFTEDENEILSRFNKIIFFRNW